MEIDKTYFDENYFTKGGDRGWYNQWAFALDNPFHKKWAEFCVQVLGIEKGARVLDIGCARGNVPLWLDKMGYQANGLDISEWAVKNAHLDHGAIQRGDISLTDEIPFEKGTFDYIISRETLEHIPPEKVSHAVNNIYNLTRVGGNILLAIATNRGDKETKKQGSDNADPSHVCIRTPYWWANKFDAVGFEIDYEKILQTQSLPDPLKFDWDFVIGVK